MRYCQYTSDARLTVKYLKGIGLCVEMCHFLYAPLIELMQELPQQCWDIQITLLWDIWFLTFFSCYFSNTWTLHWMGKFSFYSQNQNATEKCSLLSYMKIGWIDFSQLRNLSCLCANVKPINFGVYKLSCQGSLGLGQMIFIPCVCTDRVP